MLLLAAPSARAEKRIALVIGNSAYEHTPALPNPKNDARSLTIVLKRLGFEVLGGTDLKRRKFEQAVVQFSRKLRHADVGLFFYAGHGLQVSGQNYLVPVDAELKDEADLQFGMVKLNDVLAQMERSTKTSLIFIDACRDNPLARSLARAMGRTRSTSIRRGLAPVRSGIGTMITFATEPGNVAQDGEGRHSPFTAALLKHIETPGLDIAPLLRRVRRDVIKATRRAQVPWNHSSLTDGFFFREGRKSGTARKDNMALRAMRKRLAALEQQLKGKSGQKSAKTEPKVAAGIYPKQPEPSRDRLPFEPETVFVPAGSFQMGCVSGKDCQGDEKPVHRVTISHGLFMSKYEITFAQFDACVADGSCKHRPSDEGWGRGNHPVINVSWNDAVQYARWLSRKTGRKWRLPTEAEWEYAARAGSRTKYSWGNEIDCRKANYGSSPWSEECKSVNPGKTKAVGSFPANRFGIYDMHGNVWEWVSDWKGKYKVGHQTDPQGPKSGSIRVNRGGGWGYDARSLRSVYRHADSPVIRRFSLGFRLLREPS